MKQSTGQFISCTDDIVINVENCYLLNDEVINDILNIQTANKLHANHSLNKLSSKSTPVMTSVPYIRLFPDKNITYYTKPKISYFITDLLKLYTFTGKKK